MTVDSTQADTPQFMLDFPYAYGSPLGQAGFRTQLADFRVDEQLGFEPQGEGEHVYLHVEKRGDNTAWLARQIARLAGVQPMDVGYCGLKDRRAVTTQWFSVYLPKGDEPDWSQLNSDTARLLCVSRHRHKLRRGQHQTNRFTITLRDCSAEQALLEQRLQQIFQAGVPNYFGEQRFGHGGNNLAVADELLTGQKKIKNRQTRGLMISAARSYLFNLVLARRIEQADWLQSLDGEVGITPSASDAQAAAADYEAGAEAAPRLDTSLEPTGPLWGRGRPLVGDAMLALESALLASWQGWCHGLEHLGLIQERRLLLLRPLDANWQWQGADLVLDFSLPPGTFATAVLRELTVLQQPEIDSEMKPPVA